ncbi:MAG: hypothetical protein HUU38_30160 [Anaerolineales bacterium]|nr:hypothetical protein [Anaerolineales bacterium]
MTTNTLWTPVVSENLAALADLSATDAQLLVELETFAMAIAPAFQNAVFSRLGPYLLYVSPMEYELGKNALEKWFIHLFRNAQTAGKSFPRESSRTSTPPLHRKSGIPLRYLFCLQEVIFLYGKRVTLNSHNPERAFSAFQKVLGLEFAFNQVYEELYISHLSELMLDD